MSKQAIYVHVNNLIREGLLNSNEISYAKVLPLEERRWYKIIKRTSEELDFYTKEGLLPTVRKMYYRLIELGAMTKSKNNYTKLTVKSAEARRGIDSTFTKVTNLPKLPLDCFRDEKRIVIGETDIYNEPLKHHKTLKIISIMQFKV